MGHSQPLFIYYRLFNTVDSEYMNKLSPMILFEPLVPEESTLPNEPQPLPFSYCLPFMETIDAKGFELTLCRM